MWRSHTTEYYPSIKRNKVLILALTCTLNTFCFVKEASHKRPHDVGFHLYEISKISNSIKTESRQMVARGWEKTGNGEYY